MDLKHYYRLLGVKQGATRSEIKAAYEFRIARLKTPDYADDPEYVRKKTAELREAYSALTGNPLPAAKSQMVKRFEFTRSSDDDDFAEERKSKAKAKSKSSERNIRDERTTQATHTRNIETVFSEGIGQARSKYNQMQKGNNGQLIKISVIAVIILISIISSMLGSCDTNDDEIWSQPEYIANQDYESLVPEILRKTEEIDFYDYLDLDGQADLIETVEWDAEATADEERLFDALYDLIWAMGMDSPYDFVEYITGDDEIAWNNTCYENCQIITGYMGFVTYGDIGGALNTIRDEEIMNYVDYINFLGDVLNENQVYY